MPIVSLIAAPDGTPLEPAAADALRNAWGGGEIRWLDPDRVCEFTLPEVPSNAGEIGAEFQRMGVDLNVLPEENRRKRLLLADMDSTMIRQECIDELAEVAGVGAEVREITAQAMNGALDFEGALRARVALLEGMEAEVIDRVMAERITFMPGGAMLVATMKAHGATAALVSGGFTAFTEKVADALGFNTHRANTLLIAEGKLTGTVADPILGRAAKVTALEELTAEKGLSEDDALAVGDGANDLGMLGRAGLGVALHAKPAVQAEARVRINHGDLTALLYLQGYARFEFADL